MYSTSDSKNNFVQIRDLARKNLANCLENYGENQILVWDDALIGPIGLVADFQFLKERNVLKMTSIQSESSLPSDPEFKNVVFVTRPLVGLLDKIAESVIRCQRFSQESKNYHLLFSPHKSVLCDLRLKDKGQYSVFSNVDELSVPWTQSEIDVITMEDHSLYRDFHLKKDPSRLFSAAKALISLQSVFGVIPKIYAKGSAAERIVTYIKSLREEASEEEPDIHPQIDSLIILDRKIDPLSPLVTQLTYEGLLDEIFGVNCSSVQIPADKLSFEENESASERKSDIQSIPLGSSEELYAEIRDKNFNAVGIALNRKAKWITAQFEERHDAKSVRELKSFVDKLPQIQAMKQSIANHTAIARLIKDYTSESEFLTALGIEQEFLNYQNLDKFLNVGEELAKDDYDLYKLLRLLCIQCFVSSGLKQKHLEFYHKLILHSYGHQHISTLLSLEKVGLLYATDKNASNSNYPVLKKRFRLMVDDVNEQDPSDIAYVHSVYAPLSVRIIECINKSSKFNRDILDLIPGPFIEEIQLQRPKKKKRNPSSLSYGVGLSEDRKTTLVFFLGGVTFAEISALRFLSQQDDSTTDYLIATTSIITGDRFIKNIIN